MRKYKITWDTDGEDVILPEVVEVPDSIAVEDTADYISDQYGWLVSNLEEIIPSYSRNNNGGGHHKITQKATNYFYRAIPAKLGNTKIEVVNRDNSLYETQMYLFGNLIARYSQKGLEITNAGWTSKTTKERLNGLPGVHIVQKNFTWYLNGKEWDGNWIKV